AAASQPVPLRTFEHRLSWKADRAEWLLDLRSTETSYRVVVFDEHGFASKTATVRTLRIDPEPVPTVVLHPERFPPPPRFRSKFKTASLLDLGGMPLPLDDEGKPRPLKISYEAHGPYGIGKAQLKIGILRGVNESEGDAKKGRIESWVTLPLSLVP